MNDRIKEDILLLPDKPGCYQMFNSDNEIIYIGKAKNLKKRVSQYFLRSQSGKTFAMVSHVAYFKIIITKTEKEAFILEMNLIQKYLPRYNILLKDDKHYPYIALHKVKDPYISIARNLKDKKCEYFGPFPLSTNAYEMVNLLNKLFPLRKCQHVPNTPCLYYHLGQCLAPCINKISDEQYDEIFNKIKKFLRGDNKEILKEIEEKIKNYSDKLDFENANELKKFYDAIKHINDKQNVELNDKIDRDIFGFNTRDNYVSLSNFIYRKGILIGKRNFVYEIIGELNEFVASLIYQYYNYNTLPAEIVIGNEDLKDRLSEIFDNTKITLPTRGKLFELLNLVINNAKEDLDEHFASARLSDDKLKLLEELGNILHIKTPYRIELFDNSHLQGTNAIGAMVYFLNGEPLKRNYRKYNIQGLNKKDDLASMKEVITRRYTRLKEENDIMPDLIILDGGLNQVNIGLEVLKSLGLNLNIVGLVKSDKHKTSGLVTPSGEEFYFDDNKPLFYLLTRMQDEVHRYAITTHIKKRNKNMFKSIFDDTKGLGPKKIELLNKSFPNINDLKNAKIEELEQILPKNLAISVLNKIKEELK
ncbi:MAG: excinuclease ABC subunit C [Firmicutes bacterium]|uniref:UvrABC system protein C n=1 Tax=Candidatus Onthovivens merdipullorum TaxID=2840889 RepID=A0A9D9DLE2_9BACL|nr:excinuclease ABC subunit C [Candidatus Onthovivens merdipullorum]